MNVTELIDTISLFTFGTLATKKQREDYLRCLNFANNDIYLKIRNYKSFLIFKEIEVKKNQNEFYIDFDCKKNTLKSIYNKNNKLSSFDLLTNNSLNLNENEYFQLYSENKIILGCKEYNKNQLGNNFIKLFYLESLKILTETVNDPSIESDEHIFDSKIEQVLILGSVYYIFLTTNGQLSKLQSAYSLYNEKLEDILQFYNNL